MNNERNSDFRKMFLETKIKYKRNQGVNLATMVQVKNNLGIKRQVYIATGERITQEDRIKNNDKSFIYPRFILPSKHKLKYYYN